MDDMASVRGVRELVRGWRVVVAGMLGMGLGAMGLPFYAAGLFLRPLSAAFGWTRAEISVVSLCQASGTLIMAPVVGALADRYGAKRLAPIALVLSGLCYGAMSLMGHNLLELYAGWFVVTAVGSGSAAVTWSRTLNAWFDRFRGLALGVVLTGSGLVALIAPVTLAPLIAHQGWRAGFLAAGGVVLAAALPVWLLLRGQDIKIERPAARAETSGMTMTEALRARRFWQCVAGFGLVGAAVTGTLVHLPSLLADRGLSPAQVGALTGALGLTVIGGRLLVGGLIDRIHAPYVGFVFMGAAAGAALCLAQGRPAVGIALLGLALGGEIDLLTYLISRYFGLKAFGLIYGWQLALFSLAASIGPIILGAVHDYLGDYRPGLYGFALSALIGATLTATLGRYPPALAAGAAEAPIEASPA
jgi:MFS family permease